MSTSVSMDDLLITNILGPALTEDNARELALSLLRKWESYLTSFPTGTRAHGLVRDAYETHASYLARYPHGEAQNIEILAPAGDMPAAAAQQTTWKHQLTTYREYVANRRQATMFLSTRMPPSWRAAHDSDDMPTFMQPLNWWANELRNLGSLSAPEIAAKKADALKWRMLPSDNLETHLSRVANHVTQLSSFDPISAIDHLTLVTSIVSEVPYFDATLATFFQARPALADQTVDALVTLLRTAERRRPKPPTTASYGYNPAAATTIPVNATTATTTNDSLLAALATLTATVNKMQQQQQHSSHQRNRPAKSNNRANPAKPPKPPNNYCWSHGHVNHSSQDCLHPKAGHVRTTTKEHHHGGSEDRPYQLP